MQLINIKCRKARYQATKYCINEIFSVIDSLTQLDVTFQSSRRLIRSEYLQSPDQP